MSYVILIRGKEDWDVRVAGTPSGRPFQTRQDADDAANKVIRNHPHKTIAVLPLTRRDGA